MCVCNVALDNLKARRDNNEGIPVKKVKIDNLHRGKGTKVMNKGNVALNNLKARRDTGERIPVNKVKIYSTSTGKRNKSNE